MYFPTVSFTPHFFFFFDGSLTHGFVDLIMSFFREEIEDLITSVSWFDKGAPTVIHPAGSTGLRCHE